MATLIKPGKPGEVKPGQRKIDVKIVKTNPVKPMKRGGQTVKKGK